MNVKTNSFNYMSIAFVACSVTAIAAGVATFANQPQSANYATPVFTPATAPSTYALQSLQITSDTSGTAVITLDDFTLNIKFTFEAHNDSYGVPGSEFTSVAIEQLDEIRITAGGTEFRDFTNADDHQNINALIVAYIEKNQLVEVQS